MFAFYLTLKTSRKFVVKSSGKISLAEHTTQLQQTKDSFKQRCRIKFSC